MHAHIAQRMLLWLFALSAIIPAMELRAQAPIPSASSTLKFDVASVRPDKANDKAFLNVSPTPGDAGFTPTGGLYLGKNIVLASYISFAYNLTNLQLQSLVSQAPWTTEERFDIEARAEGNPTKDQYREMMRALLGERFRLQVHFETRQVPVYALVLATPDKLGPQMRLHRTDDPVCADKEASSKPTVAQADGFPALCGGSGVRMTPSAPGRLKNGGRAVPLALFAAIAPGVGVVDRPMVDETGIPGTVDFTLEWRIARENLRPGVPFQPDESASGFEQAMREQLGIKWVRKQGPQEIFVLDHIERPSQN